MNPEELERLRRLFMPRMQDAPRDVTATPRQMPPEKKIPRHLRLPDVPEPSLAQKAAQVAQEFVPGFGEVMAARRMVSEARFGRTKNAAVEGALLAAGLLPIGDIAKMVRGGKRLPMDTPSRMARASEQGFTRDVFHGTNAAGPFDEMRPSATGEFGPAIYTTTSPSEASSYAIGHNASRRNNPSPNVLPLKVRMQNPIEVSSADEFWNRYGKLGDTDDDVIAALQKQGHDGIVIRRPVETWDERAKRVMPTGEYQEHVVVFNPANVRSRFAAFNPQNTKKAGLMGGLVGMLGVNASRDNGERR